MNKITSIICVVVMVVSLASCTQSSKIDRSALNAEAIQSYNSVLEQYKKVSELSYKKYRQRKDEYPFVSELAMYDYHLTGCLYYGYYDLNGDGLDELLIGSFRDRGELMAMAEVDILVYHNGEVYSVLPDDFRKVDETDGITGVPVTSILGPGIYKDENDYKKDMVFVQKSSSPYKVYPDDPSSGYTYYESQSYFFRLNEEGDSLEVMKYQYQQGDGYYEYNLQGAIGYDSLVSGDFDNGFREIYPYEYVVNPHVWEYYDERDVHYEKLIEKNKE